MRALIGFGQKTPLSLPLHNHAELARWVKHIVLRWQLDHDINFAIIQAVCLGMSMTREDYMRVVRAYCDQKSENARLGKVKE